MKYFPDSKDYTLHEFLLSYSSNLNQALELLEEENLDKVFEAIAASIQAKATIYTCGNGGSSAIAEHLVCDFVKGASTDSTIEPKVVPLLSTPILTALANDIGYDEVFSYQVKKYGNENDLLLSVSSSGNSENIIRAIEAAKSLNMLTISFVGFDGGRAKELSDLTLHVCADNYGICEDAHHALMHIFAQYLRLTFIEDSNKIGGLKF